MIQKHNITVSVSFELPQTKLFTCHCMHCISESDVRRIVMSSPAKTCSLDPVPTFLVREFIDLLLPYITRMVNASLSRGRLPDFQKHAVVLPLLKKSGLDASDMAHFRPVSNLTVLSKVVERVVARQLNDHLAVNDLLPHH